MSKVDLNAIGIKPLNSFEQLVVGPNNQVAVSACQAILQSPGETYNPLFIYGPAGVGKTHLMQAVAQEMLKKNPSAKVRYLSAERFMSETLMAISDDRIMDVRRAFGQLDLLVLDDVQYLGESKISQEELIHVFNNLHQENHQLLLAADRSPNQLTTLSQTLRTRFEWGLATDVHVPDMPTRIEILKKKQILQDIHLDDDMLAYVAEHLRSNVRELEGFLKRMHAYITLSHQTLNMDLVRSVVSEISPEAGAATREPDAMAKRPAQREPVAPPPPPEAPRAPAKESAKEKSKAAAPPPPPPPAIPKEIDEEIERPISMASNGDIRSGRPAAAPPPPPPPPPPPVEPPKPAAIVPEVIIPDEPVPDAGSDAATGDDAAGGLKEVSAVFFYPAGQEEELEIVHGKFQEVIKKHKLKFRLRRAHSEGYEIKGKVNYSSFVDVCKMHRVAVAIVIGPKSGSHLPEQDFYDLLTVTLDVQGISLQLINWGEINKDYRYLNLALDIALVRSR